MPGRGWPWPPLSCSPWALLARNRDHMSNAPILEAWDAPCPELIRLTDELERRLTAIENRKRPRQPAECTRYRTTLLAVAGGIAMIALSRTPHDGLAVPFGNSDYVGAGLSVSELRRIRDGLEDLGLISVKLAFHDKEDPENSRYTRFYPTPLFHTLLGELRLRQLIRPPSNPIILRRAKRELAIPTDVGQSAGVLRRLNDAYAQHKLTLPTDFPHDPERIYLRRIFRYDYERGGRLYGGFWIDLPKAVRRELLLDGGRTVELDYPSLHPRILYAQEGLELTFDPYRVPGFEDLRAAGKRNFMRLLNGKKLMPPFNEAEQADFTDKATYQRFILAMREHLAPVAHRFGEGEGLKLQKLDADLAIQVLSACLDRGIVAYPVHDSFIVSEELASETMAVMEERFALMFDIAGMV